MVTTPELGECLLLPLLTRLEDGSSPPEDKTDVYLRLAEDLAKEDKQFVQEICNFSARLLCVLTRDIMSKKIDLSQAALQAVGYCLYQEQIVSSLQENDMSKIIQDLCNLIVNSEDKNLCTRALWGIGKQHLSATAIEEKLPVILKTVEHALLTFASTTVEKEALEVIYRLITQLPNELITSTAGQWSKLVYPLLISSAHKIREKAIGILELGVNHIIVARDEVVVSLLPDLKGGMLAELTKSFFEKKEIFVLRAWAILITILGESLHKSGSLINEMLKIPEQGFKSSLPDVQSMSYSVWISLIDNFAISPGFIGSLRKIKLLMMPLLLSSDKMSHNDIELGRLQAWWHLVCTIKTKYTEQIFSEICVPLFHYFFNINLEPGSTPLGHLKDGMQELTMPITPVSSKQTNTVVSASPMTPKQKSSGCSNKVVFNKGKFPDAFVKQVMLLGCEMLMEILAVDTTHFKKSRHLTEHLEAPILQPSCFRKNELFFLAVVKSALCLCANDLEDSVTLSIWTNLVNRIAALLQIGDPKDMDDVIGPLFFVAHEIITSAALSPALVLKFLEVLTKLPTKCLVHPFAFLSSVCSQGKPIFLLADILFGQLSTFKGSYVDERFHVVFENLIDAGLETPSGKLTTINNLWLSLEGLVSSIQNIEDTWRFWSKVTCSVSDIVTKSSDINQGDSLEHDFSLMISLLTFPFKQLFSGGLPGVTAKELGGDLAEFFQLFARCASIVPTAEANSCIEQLSNSLLPVVSQEKCENVRFLDGICNFIAVMVEGVDFSGQNITPLPTPSAGRASLTTSIKPKPGNALGNLNGLVSLSAKVLSVSYEVDLKHSSGSFVVAPAVMVLAGALSKFFAHLTTSQHIKETIGIICKPLASFIFYHKLSFHIAPEGRHSTEKKYSNAKFFAKIEKLWTDILTCLQSRYTAPFDSELLEAMSELLESTFCHPRRQFRNQTIMFWNAAFGHAIHLDYPINLRTCLQTVLEKTPLTLPGWDTSKLPSCDPPSTLQDSEEMTPKENIIKPQVVMLNSPKRKHGSSSPGKLKGSFLNKAWNADNNDRASPFKSNVETSASKRKSSASANVRRKLPLSLDSAEDKDFVIIAPSPKKKRLLTEHQREVRKSKKLESGHPPLYNMLDQSQDGIQSQDGTQFSEWTQTLSSQIMKIIEAPMDIEINRVSEQVVKSLDSEVESAPNSTSPNANDLLDKNANNVIKMNKTLSDENTPAKSDSVHQIGDVDVSFDEDELSPEFIPSSQTVDTVAMRENLNKRLLRSPFQSLGTKKTLPGCCSEISADSEGEAKDADNAKSENSETKDFQERDVKERSNVIESSGSPLLDGKKRRNIRLAKTSPVSSRTRMKNKPCESEKLTPKTKAKRVSNPVTFQPEARPESKPEALCDNPFPISSDFEEEFSDHQLDDTQILEEALTKDFVKSAPIVVAVNKGNGSVSSGIISDEIVAPSSPLTSSSIRLVQSKNACGSSPLHRPSRGFSSPAASPTTGILKRNKGKVDTPSPPGKTRHVSFAFPLREEKEISSESLEQDMMEEEKAESTVEMTLDFTAIKAAETKSSARTLSPEDCIFPDLVDCSTPVEQILPSLATSRWSRGLGHLVHAQNIRTVGNLSSLSEDQVQNLPIRSPKVSTLRRVLRNFHEIRASKSPKVLQQREINEISEDENQAVDADKAVTVDGGSNDFTDECSDDKQSTSTNEVAESSSETAAAPTNEDNGSDGEKTELDVEVSSIDVSESRLPDDSDKMLTPKRSRALVKRTTLFESECSGTEHQAEISNGNANYEVTDELSNHYEVTDELSNHYEVGDDELSNQLCSGSTPVAENAEEKQKCDSGICPSGISSEAEKPYPNEDNEMDIQTIIPIQDTMATFGAAVANLAILKTKEELAELSLDTLFLCHEQLHGVLSNIMSAVKSKCE